MSTMPFELRHNEGKKWTIVDEQGRIVFTGQLSACEDWLDHRENASRGRRHLIPRGILSVSPYLNLLRGGQSFGDEYFTRVRPQNEFRRGGQALRNSVNELRRHTRQLQSEIVRQSARRTIGPTGHRATFLDYRGYFLQR